MILIFFSCYYLLCYYVVYYVCPCFKIRVFKRSGIVRSKSLKSNFVRHPSLLLDIFLSFEFSSRVFSSNFVSAVFSIETVLRKIQCCSIHGKSIIYLSQISFRFNQKHQQTATILHNNHVLIWDYKDNKKYQVTMS